MLPKALSRRPCVAPPRRAGAPPHMGRFAARDSGCRRRVVFLICVPNLKAYLGHLRYRAEEFGRKTWSLLFAKLNPSSRNLLQSRSPYSRVPSTPAGRGATLTAQGPCRFDWPPGATGREYHRRSSLQRSNSRAPDASFLGRLCVQ
jgi:hypothetical protein